MRNLQGYLAKKEYFSIKSKQSKEQECYLFTVPREIRDEIYRLVLSDQHQRTIWPPSVESCDPCYPGGRINGSILTLAETCRQLHNEILEIYYCENRFSFSTTQDLYRYLLRIGQKRRALIRKLDFVYDAPRLYPVLTLGEIDPHTGTLRGYPSAFALLGNCVNLKCLRIGFYRRCSGIHSYHLKCLAASISLLATRELQQLEVKEVWRNNPSRGQKDTWWESQMVTLHDPTVNRFPPYDKAEIEEFVRVLAEEIIKEGRVVEQTDKQLIIGDIAQGVVEEELKNEAGPENEIKPKNEYLVPSKSSKIRTFFSDKIQELNAIATRKTGSKGKGKFKQPEK